VKVKVCAKYKNQQTTVFRQSLVSNDDDYAVLTFIFPSEFVTQLASFDDERFDFLIAEWRKFEEVPYDNEDDLRDLFTNLVRLARAADQSGLNMYLWNCL